MSLTQELSLPEIYSSLSQQIEQLLVLLSQKERFVVERRFSLTTDKRSTLEEIGQHFNVTRERIRQIEKNAMQKLRRNIENYNVFAINNAAFAILKAHGDVLREDLLLGELLMSYPDVNVGSVVLLLSLDKRFVHVLNTIHYHPYFYNAQYTQAVLEKVCETTISYLQSVKKTQKVLECSKVLEAKVPESQVLQPASFVSLFQIHKSFKLVDNDQVGLNTWRDINPRTLRDKIFFILRKNKSPLHFVDIANSIVSTGFDKKTLNLQAVHNELIRHDEFVLVGRGIYALKEWGFDHGTVADVIISLLSKKESMSEDEIIEGVLKTRKVKPITIILNLKNKPQFVRVGRKQYALKAKTA